MRVLCAKKNSIGCLPEAAAAAAVRLIVTRNQYTEPQQDINERLHTSI